MAQRTDVFDMDGVLAEIATLPCWAARRGHGSFLTFDFGDRRIIKTRRGSKEVGTYHLWVYLSRWKLIAGSDNAGWTSTYDEVDRVLRKFEGTPVIAIQSVPTVIRFGGSGGPVIELIPEENADADDALFHLYLPEHRVLSCFPQGNMTLEDDRTP